MSEVTKVDMWALYPKLMERHLAIVEMANAICIKNGKELNI